MINPDLLSLLSPLSQEEAEALDCIRRGQYVPSIPKPVIMASELLEQGKHIDIVPHVRFKESPPHIHDYVEVVYMCRGKTTHIVNGNTVLLKNGELLFLHQSSEHSVLMTGEEDIAINFIILPSFFVGPLKMLGYENTPLRSFIINCLYGEIPSVGYMHFRVADAPIIQNLVENLIWSLKTETLSRRTSNEYTMGLLLLNLIDCTDRLSHSSQTEELIFSVLDYIERNFRTSSLSELSQSLGYSRSYLSHEIKSKTGKSFIELVHEKRLAQAQFLLKNTKLSIAQIADQVGYCNSSYFYRLFQKEFGFSPLKYRNTR